MLDRRAFLSGSAATGLSFGGSVALGETSAPGGIATPIEGAFGKDTRALGWVSPNSDRLDCRELALDGKLPENLTGTLWRNGPAAHDRHGIRYRHWFDGDGMIQEFRFADGKVSHRGRMIETPKLRHEDAAGRRIYPAFGTRLPGSAAVAGPDAMNVANISVLDHGGALMALWEGGSASVLDRETLDWQAFKSWGDGLKGLPFTAHPKRDPNGTLWAFGYALIPSTSIVLYHISATGQIIKATAVPVEPLGMVHDFVVTNLHLVIVIPPYVYDLDRGRTFLDGHIWKPELGARVLIVSKDSFDDRRWVQLPPGFGFHHGNGWEEANGTIHFDHCLAKDAGLVSDAFLDVMNGQFGEVEPPTYCRISISKDGRADIRNTGEVAEFPQVSPLFTGIRNQFVYTLDSLGRKDWLPRMVVKRDLAGASAEKFDFGPGTVVEEHVFVPSPEGRFEDDGWLVGTFLEHGKGVSGVTVFDARQVSAGPVATAWLPYPLPLGFHGQFSNPSG
ncbi:MAG: carotenoid oxygenase family protein [Albidovulum sp.]|nr:carotenoid oxygenase family protein [Albidovulum sp.]